MSASMVLAPDVFPATDRALQSVTGVSSASALQALAEQWRPWRSYAALHLWLEDDARSARVKATTSPRSARWLEPAALVRTW